MGDASNNLPGSRSEQRERVGKAHGPPLLSDLRIACFLGISYGVLGALATLVLVPATPELQSQPLPLPLKVFALAIALVLASVYTLLSLAGLLSARAAGIQPASPPAWLSRSSLIGDRHPRPWWPAAVSGGLTGVFLVGAVAIIRSILPATLPPVLHPPTLLSALLASSAAAFGEEILCRLLVLSLLLWALPKRPAAKLVAVAASSCMFGLLHTPGVVYLYGGFAVMPVMVFVWIVLLNGVAGLAFAREFLRAGIGAAILAHWCCDLVWHVCSVLFAGS